MYFGKLVKNCQPNTGMSNMLWWFDTMMYDRCGSIFGDRSTSKRIPARRMSAISTLCSAPITYWLGRRPNRNVIRITTSNTASVSPKAIANRTVPTQLKMVRMASDRDFACSPVKRQTPSTADGRYAQTVMW
jgi:hypothetical protein